MEDSGPSPAGSSQPSPGLMGDMPAPVQGMAGDLSAPGEDEGSESIRERVITGLKVLNRERDMLYKLRAELKRLRKQREGLYSRHRGSMDAEIQLAKVRVEHQETIMAMMEGKDGPFKEKFCNERRFSRMAKMEVEEETPSSDPLPPQGEVSSPGPSQDSGGMLRVIQVMESPMREDQMVFGNEDIPDDMPDKVKEQYEKKSGKNPGEFKAVLVSTQVVAGTNYFFKVDTGEDTYIHVRVFVPLPGSDEGPTLVSFQENKTKDDELEYF